LAATETINQRLAVDGFVSIERIATDEDVARIRRILETLFERQAGFAEGAYFDFLSADDKGDTFVLPQLLDPRSFAPELVKTEFFREASKIARAILGPQARFAADHALKKPALIGGMTPWHQDEAFQSHDHLRNEISIWMPLQAVDRSNGCMSFIAGSHHGDILPHRSLQGDARIHALECIGGFDPEEAIECPIPAGGCTIHTSRTLHASAPNISGSPRFAYVLIFHAPVASPIQRTVRPWLHNRVSPRQDRRRKWMHRSGLFIHSWRRTKQIKEIGIHETIFRIYLKLFPGPKR
jgi:ectoine hydroxylase-related dioxygenase (phytanoyl-CoA dioxygenase family)